MFLLKLGVNNVFSINLEYLYSSDITQYSRGKTRLHQYNTMPSQRRRHHDEVAGVVAQCWWGPGARFNATTPPPTRGNHVAVTSLPSPQRSITSPASLHRAGGDLAVVSMPPRLSQHVATTPLSPRCHRHTAETCDRRRCNVMVRTWWPFHCNHVSANT